MDITTTLSFLSTIAPSVIFHELSPNSNVKNVSNSSSIISDFPYDGPDFNLTFPHVSSHHSDITLTTAKGTYPKRRGPFKPRMPRIAHQEFLHTMDTLVMPIAYAVGIIGSLMVIPICTCTPLKASALAHYLTALGVADALYLLACLPVWISKQGYRFNNVIGVCQLTMFTLRLSRFMSTWFLFAAHLERCLVHFGSQNARAWSSTFRTKCIILVFFIFSLVGFLHYIWTHVVREELGRAACTVMRESFKHIIKLDKIELVASTFLPMMLIIPMDVALLTKLVVGRLQKLKTRQATKNGRFSLGIKTNAGSNNGSGLNNKHRESQSDRMEGYVLAHRNQSSNSPQGQNGIEYPPPPEFDLSRENSRATLVVIICGVLFVGFMLPSSIQRAKLSLFEMRFNPTPEQLFIANFIEYLDKFNYVFKFFIYLFLLRGFRKGFLYLRHCARKRTDSEQSLQETEV